MTSTATTAVFKQDNPTDDELLQAVVDLYDRTYASLLSLSTGKNSPRSSLSLAHIRWDMLSNAEVHIMNKLVSFLDGFIYERCLCYN